MPEFSVLVTGAGGFLATHVIRLLQEAGHRVRGSVRDVLEEAKVGPLWELCPAAKHTLELIEADLTTATPRDWKAAATGCQYVIHMAAADPESAVSVLRGVQAAGGVRRVVFTSCVAAVTTGTCDGGDFDEDDWTDVTTAEDESHKTKTLAEKAAWEFWETLPVYDRFELVVLNPCHVVGPVLSGGGVTTAMMEMCRCLLQRDLKFVPRVDLPLIDVRDVASAHVAALTADGAVGRRHILYAKTLRWKEVAELYEREFDDKFGYDVPTTEAPYVVFRVLALCDKSLEALVPLWGKEYRLSNARMLSVLGILPRSPRDALVDMAYSMLERGLIRKTAKYMKLEREKREEEEGEEEKGEEESTKEEDVIGQNGIKKTPY